MALSHLSIGEVVRNLDGSSEGHLFPKGIPAFIFRGSKFEEENEKYISFFHFFIWQFS